MKQSDSQRVGTICRRCVAVVLAVVVGLFIFLNSAETSDLTGTVSRTASALSVSSTSAVKPKNIMTAKACINCHRSEYLAWTNSKHHDSLKTLRIGADNSKKYVAALGLKGEATEVETCLQCHGTPKMVDDRVMAASGVSCESCHGESGGDTGWLNAHASYGLGKKQLEDEDADHLKQRIKKCETAGMIRTPRLYKLAKQCLSCHNVTNEKLVNAGHKPGEGYELVGYSTGEVRHNFHEDTKVNAAGPSLWVRRMDGKGKVEARKRVKFLVGILVDVEVALNALGSVTEEGDFIEKQIERVGFGTEVLGGILEVLEDDAPEELAMAMELIEEAEFEDNDYTEEEGRNKVKEAAAKIAKIAMKFAERDGSKLEAIDEFVNEEVVDVRGKPYERSK